MEPGAPIAEIVAPQVPELVEPEPEPLSAAQEPAQEPAEVVSITAPSAPREPDPAEISAPPSAPRRGWWRRGA